jgi:hypothetical protein
MVSLYLFSFILIILLYVIIILILKKYYDIYFSKSGSKSIVKEEKRENHRICLLYAYYEKNELYKNNFTYFLENGILPEVDYYIIVNGKCTVKIPHKLNIKVYFRENKGYDFGAYSYCIHNHLKKEYDYYFFMNTSVIGPYLKKKIPWYTPFLELFHKNVAIVGTSINIFETKDINEIYGKKNVYSHVQSMFFCIPQFYLNYLKKMDFFDEKKINEMTNILEVIVYKEVGLSQLAIQKGWNINCILDKYKNLDYVHLDKNINLSSKKYGGDPYYEGAYFEETIDKYDVIFYKNNRASFTSNKIDYFLLFKKYVNRLKEMFMLYK